MHVRIPDDAAIDAAISRLIRERAASRLHKHDATLFGAPDTPEIADRLGWLDLPGAMPATVAALTRQVPRAERIFLVGMGGSSLAPEVFWRAAGMASHQVVDSTHPAAVLRAASTVTSGDLIIAASKSGTTVETRTILDVLFERHRQHATFMTITDPGSPLQHWADEHGCLNLAAPPDVGGRFSALSVFGLAPAVAAGLNPMQWQPALADVVRLCQRDGTDNPGLVLAAALAAAWQNGRDVLLVNDHPKAPLFPWIEQLLAESLGKQGMGLIPLAAADQAGQPIDADQAIRLYCGPDVPAHSADILLTVNSFADMVAAMFVLEIATALAGHLLGVHPFNQPDVERAKSFAREAMAGRRPALDRPTSSDLDAWLDGVSPDHCLVVQAFVDPPDMRQVRQLARGLAKRAGTWINVSRGPRYLHASGQLHKARSDRFSFLNLVDQPTTDCAIPGAAFTMGQLLRAQADADVAALREKGARVFGGYWNDLRPRQTGGETEQ
ncbi:MAG: hypothetical protein D6761_11070 [Candidatus Dadabacteria bacterium]|nr:MAG: hypothetical protein D6761_11070 [Candidatus Dadabacteria bacterium]